MALNHYYALGNSGLRVSRLALGTLTFGTDWGWGADKETARAMFNAYIDAGGNLIDTADMYTNGVSETWVGEFIKERNLRDYIVLSTKFSFNPDPSNPNSGGNSRKNILRAIDTSLSRLKTDYIDLYLLHNWDQLTPVDEVMRTFDDLISAGKIRHAGLSNVPSWYASRGQAIAECRNQAPITAMQMAYSLVNREIEDEYIPLGTRHGMGTMAWSPLGGGLLSGKYKPSENGEHGEGRLQGLNHPAFPEFDSRNFTIVSELENVANKLGRSMSQVAINWVANQPGIATVLIGATKQSQLDDNLQALDFQIPSDLIKQLDEASSEKRRYPYIYFEPVMQNQLAGNNPCGDKPQGYYPTIFVPGSPETSGES